MQAIPKASLLEIQSIISRMSIEMCEVSVLPELRLQWREVARALRDHRLVINAANIALVVVKHVANTFTPEHVDEVLDILRLKSYITQNKVWHTVSLLEPFDVVPGASLSTLLSNRILNALSKMKSSKTIKPEVRTVAIGEVVYCSVRAHRGRALYAAVPPTLPVLFVSVLPRGALIKVLVEAIGYKNYEFANLFGPDIMSLLRIYNRNDTEIAERLSEIPEYHPRPVVNSTGIDYTAREYDEAYVEAILGRDPPLLTNLQLTTTAPFFDSGRINKMITLKVNLKSDNVALTFKRWAAKRAMSPSSEFFQFFRKVKTNRIVKSQ